MMRSLAFALMMLGTQAQALSCMRPDPVSSFLQYQDAPDPYFIMHGTLTFDQSKMPQGVENAERTPDPVSARFVGHGLTETGFDVVLDRDITLQPICYGPWCGALESGQDYLIFARSENATIRLEIDPCGTTAFSQPPQVILDKMTACLQGKVCLTTP